MPALAGAPFSWGRSTPVNPFPHDETWNSRFGARKVPISRPGARRVSAPKDLDPVHKLGRLRRDRRRVEQSPAGSASELRSRWEEVTEMRDQLQAVARRGSLQGGGGAVQALLQEANAEADAIGRASRLLRRFDVLDSGRRVLMERLQRVAHAASGAGATRHIRLIGSGGLVVRELSLLVERLREQTINAVEAWSHLQAAAAGIGSGGGMWQDRDILDEYAAGVSEATQGSTVAELLGFGMADNPFFHPSCPPVREHAMQLQPYTQMRIEELLNALGAQYSYIPASQTASLNALRRAPLTALPPLGLPSGPPARLPLPRSPPPKEEEEKQIQPADLVTPPMPEHIKPGKPPPHRLPMTAKYAESSARPSLTSPQLALQAVPSAGFETEGVSQLSSPKRGRTSPTGDELSIEPPSKPSEVKSLQTKQTGLVDRRPSTLSRDLGLGMIGSMGARRLSQLSAHPSDAHPPGAGMMGSLGARRVSQLSGLGEGEGGTFARRGSYIGRQMSMSAASYGRPNPFRGGRGIALEVKKRSQNALTALSGAFRKLSTESSPARDPKHLAEVLLSLSDSLSRQCIEIQAGPAGSPRAEVKRSPVREVCVVDSPQTSPKSEEPKKGAEKVPSLAALSVEIGSEGGHDPGSQDPPGGQESPTGLVRQTSRSSSSLGSRTRRSMCSLGSKVAIQGMKLRTPMASPRGKASPSAASFRNRKLQVSNLRRGVTHCSAVVAGLAILGGGSVRLAEALGAISRNITSPRSPRSPGRSPTGTTAVGTLIGTAGAKGSHPAD